MAQSKWQRTRVWPLPMPFHLIQAATAVGASAAFACNLTGPSVAFLRECSVGRSSSSISVLPAAALFEIATAAAQMLLDSQQLIQLMQCMVQSAVTMPDMAHGQSIPLLCSIDAKTGAALVSSGSAHHFAADAVAVVSMPVSMRFGQHTVGYLKKLLQHAMEAAAHQRAAATCAVATVCRPQLQLSTGYLVHPAATEAATLLQAAVNFGRALHTTAVSCQAYSTTCSAQPQDLRVSAALVSQKRLRSAVDISCRQPEASKLVAAFTGLVLGVKETGSSSRAAESPAFQLMWQPIASEAATPVQAALQKWLILSSQPCSLQDICSDVDASTTALNVVYGSVPPAHSTAAIMVSCDAELQLILAEAQADHCFLVQRPDQAAASNISGPVAVQSQAESAAMLWAFRAFRRARPSSKLSLVTWGTQAVGPYGAAAGPASLMALGVPPTHLLISQLSLLIFNIILSSSAKPTEQAGR